MFNGKKEEPTKEFMEASIAYELSQRKVRLETSAYLLEVRAIKMWLDGDFSEGNKIWESAEKVRTTLREEEAYLMFKDCFSHGKKEKKIKKVKKVKKVKKAGKSRGTCHICGNSIPGSSRRWKYCSLKCYRKGAEIRHVAWLKKQASKRSYDNFEIK